MEERNWLCSDKFSTDLFHTLLRHTYATRIRAKNGAGIYASPQTNVDLGARPKPKWNKCSNTFGCKMFVQRLSGCTINIWQKNGRTKRKRDKIGMRYEVWLWLIWPAMRKGTQTQIFHYARILYNLASSFFASEESNLQFVAHTSSSCCWRCVRVY